MKTKKATHTATLPVKINGVTLEGGHLVLNQQTNRIEAKRLNIDCTGFAGDLSKWKDDNESAIVAALTAAGVKPDGTTDTDKATDEQPEADTEGDSLMGR